MQTNWSCTCRAASVGLFCMRFGCLLCHAGFVIAKLNETLSRCSFNDLFSGHYSSAIYFLNLIPQIPVKTHVYGMEFLQRTINVQIITISNDS